MQSNPFVNPQTFEFVEVTPVINDLIGGRLSLQTPFTGLNAAVSSFAGNFEMDNPVLSLDEHYVIMGPSLEYASEHWKICSEYLTQVDSSKISLDSIYLEASYQVTEHWQIAARYEHTDVEIDMPPDLDYVPSSTYDHQETVFGLNYWLNPNLVFKLSYHIVEGNRFAFPEDGAKYLQHTLDGNFEETTHLVLVGTQFSF